MCFQSSVVNLSTLLRRDVPSNGKYCYSVIGAWSALVFIFLSTYPFLPGRRFSWYSLVYLLEIDSCWEYFHISWQKDCGNLYKSITRTGKNAVHAGWGHFHLPGLLLGITLDAWWCFVDSCMCWCCQFMICYPVCLLLVLISWLVERLVWRGGNAASRAYDSYSKVFFDSR